MAVSDRKKVIIRTNILTLMLLAYTAVLIVFLVLVWCTEMSTGDVWNCVEAPLMALIGGTLAISKDLVSPDESDPNQEGNNGITPSPQPNQQGSTNNPNP
ncbi:MAG: hypothetical protein OXI37_10640 [Gammaproteobacteria bacterium]|nr:hypothetical protein [Gammaproteobacteria bacterium]